MLEHLDFNAAGDTAAVAEQIGGDRRQHPGQRRQGEGGAPDLGKLQARFSGGVEGAVQIGAVSVSEEIFPSAIRC